MPVLMLAFSHFCYAILMLMLVPFDADYRIMELGSYLISKIKGGRKRRRKKNKKKKKKKKKHTVLSLSTLCSFPVSSKPK